MIEPVAKDKCLPELVALFPELVAHRHDIHQHPDCGFETQRTIGKIKEFLEKHNVPPKDMDDTTCPGSLFVEIKGNLPGKTIGFRADIDALKMKDLSGKEWSSQIDGQAHACGHDGHQTWLMGAAADLDGRQYAIFPFHSGFVRSSHVSGMVRPSFSIRSLL